MKSFDRQAECFEYADKNGLAIFFKAFIQQRTRFYCCKNVREWCKGIHRRTAPLETSQELLRDGKWLAPYWDLDAYFPTDEGFETRRHNVITAFEKLLELVLPLIDVEFDRDCLERSDSSGATDSGFKLSLHAVYADPSIGFEYNRANQDGRDLRKSLDEFGKLCIQRSEPFEDLWYNSEDGGVVTRTCMIDKKVWTTNRCMRCVGCNKPGDDRVLLPLDTSTEECDRFYSRSDIEDHLISRTMPPQHPCVIKSTVPLVTQPKRVVYTRSVLQHIAEKLGCQIDRVESNLVTLKTNPEGRVCPISHARYMPGNNRCYLTMRSGEIHYNQFGVDGSLKMGQVETEKTYESFRDIDKLFALYRRLKQDFTVDHIKAYLRDVVIYIQAAFQQRYIVKVDGYKHGFGFEGIVNQFAYKSDPVKEGLFGKGGPRFRVQGEKGVKTIKVDTVLEHMRADNQLETYNEECFVPFTKKMPYIGKRVFNTFIPFSMTDYSERSKPVPPFEQHGIYKLMKRDLTGDHPVAFGYLLDYIAHKLQHPNIRIETALCFIRTVQGVGKGQMAKWLTMLFDERNCKTVANLDHLFGRFNAHLQKSLWVFLEEIKSKGSAWEHSGRLKDLISSTDQNWEKKYHETESGGWYGQIVIFSNDSYGIRIENCDRRYVVFDTKYHYRDDKDLHDRVAAETMCPDHIAEAYKFFMKRDVSKWNWRNIPETKTRLAVKECCENVFLSFTRWLFEKETNFSFQCFEYEEDRIELNVAKQYCVTYPAHLVAAFRQDKHVTQHPSKVNYKRQILDGLEQLWGPCWVRKTVKRQRCIRIFIPDLQRELSRQFRGQVNLEILKNEVAESIVQPCARLSPFDGPMGAKEKDA